MAQPKKNTDKKIPKFRRSRAFTKKRLDSKTWRKPRGLHNKQRLEKKSRSAKVKIGYAIKKESKGKIKGKTPVLIHSIEQILKLTQENIAIISAKVGARKRIQMIKELAKKKIEVSNINEINECVNALSKEPSIIKVERGLKKDFKIGEQND